MTVGEKIKQYRKERKLTQKKLGELAGSSEAMIRQYELGLRNPKIETIEKIADALSVKVLDIMGFTYFDENFDPERRSKEVQLIEDLELYFGKPSVELLQNFMRLNDVGRKKVIEYSDDLAFLPIYRINESDSE